MKHHTTSHYDFNCGPLSTEIDAAERRIRGVCWVFLSKLFNDPQCLSRTWNIHSSGKLTTIKLNVNFSNFEYQLVSSSVRPLSLEPLSIVIPLSAAVAA